MTFRKNDPRLIATLLLTTAIALLCVEKPSDKCRPTISTCSGNPCMFYKIYDENNQFVAEGASAALQIAWDGKDCHGTDVPCGSYTVEMTVVSGSNSQTSKSIVLIKRTDTESATGRSACDSLKAACTGRYRETEFTSIDGLSNNVGCICCQ